MKSHSVILAALVLTAGAASPIGAATLYYVGNGGDPDVWHDARFWATTPGGTGGANGATVPGAGDRAVFDTESPSCTLDANVTVDGLDIQSEFSGTFDMNGKNLTQDNQSNIFRVQGGTFQKRAGDLNIWANAVTISVDIPSYTNWIRFRCAQYQTQTISGGATLNGHAAFYRQHSTRESHVTINGGLTVTGNIYIQSSRSYGYRRFSGTLTKLGPGVVYSDCNATYRIQRVDLRFMGDGDVVFRNFRAIEGWSHLRYQKTSGKVIVEGYHEFRNARTVLFDSEVDFLTNSVSAFFESRGHMDVQITPNVDPVFWNLRLKSLGSTGVSTFNLMGGALSVRNKCDVELDPAGAWTKQVNSGTVFVHGELEVDIPSSDNYRTQGSATFRMVGSNDAVYDGNGYQPRFNHLVIDKDPGATVTVSAGSLSIGPNRNVTVNSGALHLNGRTLVCSRININPNGTLIVLGNETISGSVGTNEGTVEYAGTGDYPTLVVGHTYTHLKFTGNGGVWRPTNTVTVSRDLTIAAGTTFDLEDEVLSASGELFNDGLLRLEGGSAAAIGAMDIDSGTVEYTGGGAYSLLAAGYDYHDVLFSGTGAWQVNDDLEIHGDLDVAGGSLTMGTVGAGSPATLTVTGDAVFAAGATFDGMTSPLFLGGNFDNGGGFTSLGTVTFNGAAQDVRGSTVFNNLTRNSPAPATLRFEAGSTQTVNGTLNLQGAAGALLALRSLTPGSQWNLQAPGTRVVQYVDVQDSNNLLLPVINPALSINSGNNLRWWDDLVPNPSASPMAIMLNDAISLFCAPVGGSGDYVSFEWTGPGGFTSNLQNPVGVVPVLVGDNTYTVTVTDSANTTASASVTVNAAVDPLLPRPSAAPTAIVLGDSVELSCDPVGGSGTYIRYEWTGPAGFASDLQNPGFVATPLVGEHLYTVSVWDSVGLFSQASVTVTVVAYPLLANPSATPIAIAAGESITLSCTPTGGSGVYVSFSWTGPDGFTSSQQNPDPIKIDSAGMKTYTVTVTDSLGFTDTASVTVPVVESALRANPVANPDLLTTGQSTTLTCLPTGGTGEYISFVWEGPNGFSSSVQNPGLVTPRLPGANIYTVTVTDASGLVATESVCVVVGIAVNQLHVKPGWIRYKASSTSDMDRPLDQVKITLQGLDMLPGDRISLLFNNRRIGDLSSAGSLTLDQKLRARGQLASDPYLFHDVRVRYVAKRRKLLLRASRGVMFTGSQPMVMAASGISDAVPVAVLVDRVPYDGFADFAAVVYVHFKVKVRSTASGTVVESGKKTGP